MDYPTVYHLWDRNEIIETGTFRQLELKLDRILKKTPKRAARMRICELHLREQPLHNPHLWNQATDIACEESNLAEEQCIPFSSDDFDETAVRHYYSMLLGEIVREHHFNFNLKN